MEKDKMNRNNFNLSLISSLIILLSILILISISNVAYSGTPNIISIQGKAVDKSTGTLLTSGNVSIRVYTEQTGGSEVYSENFTNVITNGTFSVTLGNTTDMNLTYNDKYWIEIDINNEEVVGNETTGRRPFIATAGPQSTIFYVNESTGRVGIGTTSPGAKLEVNIGSQNVSAIFNSTDSTNVLRIKDSTSGADIGVSSGIYRVSSQGGAPLISLNLTSGNVGIGTTDPGAELEIYSNTPGFMLIDSDDTRSSQFGQNSNQINLYGIFSSTKQVDKTIMSAGAGSGIVTFPHAVYMATTNGNVGIGTASPEQELHVQGHILVNATNSQLDIFESDTSKRWRIEGTGGDLALTEVGQSTWVTVQNTTGNVGIGTASPSADLELVTDATTGNGIFINASSVTTGNGLLIEVDGANMASGNAFRITRDGSKRFAISEWGHISAAEYIIDSQNYIDGYDRGMYRGTDDTPTIIGSTNNQDVWIYPHGTGNVGIGTTNPGDYKLNVAGDVNASSYATNGTDYAEMFEKLYPDEGFEAGDIIAVVNGKVTKPENVENAALYMVVTDSAGVVGNKGVKDGVIVSFIGKVRVKVSNEVNEGDYVLADGHIGYAKPKSEVTFEEFKNRVVGVALERSNGGTTLVAVGVK